MVAGAGGGEPDGGLTPGLNAGALLEKSRLRRLAVARGSLVGCECEGGSQPHRGCIGGLLCRLYRPPVSDHAAASAGMSRLTGDAVMHTDETGTRGFEWFGGSTCMFILVASTRHWQPVAHLRRRSPMSGWGRSSPFWRHHQPSPPPDGGRSGVRTCRVQRPAAMPPCLSLTHAGPP